MSLGDSANNKDIRQRAEDFLEHGVLGCCPELKAALGKTIADNNAPKQPEKQLPNVENHNGRRFDPNGKWQEGMKLNLFPDPVSQSDLSGQPNFGWVPDGQKRSPEERNQAFIQSLQKLADGPRVIQEVWEVDEGGNPTKLVRTSDESESEQDDDLKGKGLGRTLREMNPGNTLIARAAKKFGVWVDDLGKFRCPPGTPQANQFTDEFGSTCFAVSAGQIVNAAQEGLASIGDWWRRSRQRRLPFFIDEFGNVTENVRIASGEQDYKRIFTGSRARVRSRIIELEGNIADLLKIHKIKETPGSNDDLRELLKRVAPQATINTMDADSIWGSLSDSYKARLAEKGITKQALIDSERGFLAKLAELALTDPDRLAKISTIEAVGDLPSEAVTNVADPKGKASDVKYEILYNPLEMSRTVVQQIMEVRENQRLGLRVVNAATDEEAADAMHKFVVNENQWAGGMTASLGKNQFLTKGVHTSIHEISHTIQIDKFAEVLIAQRGESVRFSDVNNRGLFGAMKEMDDGLDLEDLGLVLSDLERVAFLGGRYGAQEWEETGSVSELWKLEATAELYALREMGVIEGDDVDMALSWMDDMGATKNREMREASKKKNRTIVERNARKPLVRPDGRRDHPDSPAPARPRKARSVKTATEASNIGARMRRQALPKLDNEEREALERIPDPRSHQIASLIDPEQMTTSILSIDSNHKLARKHGVDLDEVDVSGSTALSRVAYDQKKRRLYVAYKGKEGSSDRVYYYRDVDAETVLELHKSDSKGKAINEIKKIHDNVKVDGFPEKLDYKNPNEGDIGSQVRHNLIPILTALDKTEVGREMRVVISVDPSKRGGEISEVRGITTARIYYDGIPMGSDEVVLSIPADGRGLPIDADVFDREKTGSTSLLMMPPMRIAVLDDKDGRRAELIDQPSSTTVLNRMIDEWPSGADAKEGRIISASRRKAEEAVAVHVALGEGSGSLPDGSTSPIGARRIRTRNADIHDRQKSRKSSPTRPTRGFIDSLASTGFSSMGRPETPNERRMARTNNSSSVSSKIRSLPNVDPEISRILSNNDDRAISEAIESVAIDFHNGIDRRPRMRVSNAEMDKILSDGGRHFSERGNISNAERSYQTLMGIHPETDDIDRPISGYVIHPAQDESARNVLRRSGRQIGDSPMEWPLGSNPHGDIDGDGDIEIVLKPEVSGRTAYGFGYGIDNRTRPVWMNSDNASDISDALVHLNADEDEDGSNMRAMNALSAAIDGDFGYFTDTGSVKPAATSQNEKTEDFIKRTIEHSKNAKPQRLGAHIMGGFVNEEIAEIRIPWSSVTKSSSDMDISDVINKEPVSDRLRRLGFTDQEIEYFYKVNGERSLDYLSSATMASLRDYRKAVQIQKDYTSRGIPAVSFMHPAGLDPLDVSSYSQNPQQGISIEGALAAAINQEVDQLVEKMLKQVRKTRGKLWEMRQAAVPA